jgi:ketosteroid isomerase-like protein
MKHLITAVFCFFCIQLFVSCKDDEAEPVPSEDAQKAVLAAHEMRRVATLNENVAVLDSLMMDDLTFMHPNAVVDTKAQFLNSLSNQSVQFTGLTDEDLTVRVHGTTGVVSGIVRVQVIASGTPVDVRVRFTELWVKEGDMWRMLLWQATAV